MTYTDRAGRSGRLLNSTSLACTADNTSDTASYTLIDAQVALGSIVKFDWPSSRGYGSFWDYTRLHKLATFQGAPSYPVSVLVQYIPSPPYF
jgi:hypothetical protein